MKPLAVSMGDPAGIGLELAAKLWSARLTLPPFFLVGDSDALLRAARRAGLSAPTLNVFEAADALTFAADTLSVLHTPLAIEETPGEPTPTNASPTIAAIEAAVTCVLGGHASALVTMPIAKSVLHSADFGFPGHTEFIAHLSTAEAWSGARGPVMMLAGPSLRVALATIHVPLAGVAGQLTHERLISVGKVLHEALQRDFGVERPRIALCGLNPHAGERGGIGREEIEIVAPAAALLRARGVDITDPKPADSLFHSEARANYDAVLALYHDQGLIPIKTLHFWEAVNVTLGLPIVRTSPDHGAGFDIAGEGKARPDSAMAALKLAWAMAERRART